MFENRNGTPFSSRYQDIYFSSDHGLEESRHVFVKGSNLDRRWQHKPRFVIAESGFGTGLNFLATWEHWRNDVNRPDVLHYISVEKHPLTSEDLAVCHHRFSELADLSLQLIAKYPDAYPGFHRIWLDQNRVCLTLCFMDVCKALKELDAVVDCWYLDGFAPAKNPDMWTAEVFRHLARLGKAGTSIATFTAAGSVRRGLTEAGFEIKKVTGFGRKREMIIGLLKTVPRVRTTEPWRNLPKPVVSKKTATVIGAGIAGAQVAWHLAQRGVQVTILERGHDIATGASGNPRAIIAPRLTAKPSLEEAFSVAGFLATQNQLEAIAPGSESWSQCGVLSLVNSERKQEQWQAIVSRQLPAALVVAIDAKEASEIARVQVTRPALYYPKGGWLVPKDIVRLLLAHPLISLHRNTIVTRLDPVEDRWHIAMDDGSQREAEIVILASGSSISSLSPAEFSVDLIAGQTTFAKSSEESDSLHCVLQHSGYITPARNGKHLIGASYHRNSTSLLPDQNLNLKNLRQQQHGIPGIAGNLGNPETAHTGIRVATRTRFPLVGSVPDTAFFANAPAANASGVSTSQPFIPGLFVAGAFGSRGFTTSALAAEILCSEILDEPAPISLSLKRAVEPVRWLRS